MLANLNLALGLAAFFGWGVGGGLFVFTLFSFSHTIILGGLVLSVLIALFLFALFYRWIARMPSKDRAPAATIVLVVLHGLLLVANVIALLFGVPLVYGAIFEPAISNAIPLTGSAVFAAIVTSAALSLGLLVERGRRPLRSLQGQ